jgi:uncharacterized YceG family protein
VSIFGRKEDADGRTRAERSEEERERARLEREARRRQREAPAPAPAPEPPPPAIIEEEEELEPVGVARPATQAASSPVTPERGLTSDFEAPAGVKRVPASERMTAAGALGPSAIPPRPSKPARRRRRRLRFLVLLAVIAGAGWFAYELFQPFHGDGSGRAAVIIPQGSSASEIGHYLERANVIDSAFFFDLRARIAGKREQLRSGRFDLKQHMSYGSVLHVLTTAPAAAKTVKLTIPEGRSRQEIVPLVKNAGLRGSYLAATKRSPRSLGGPSRVRTLEGYLFPATYELRPGAPARALVKEQLKAFGSAFGSLDLSYAKRKHLTRYDILIIASMIEREAQLPKDRPLIAAVIYNRLHRHMPLGIDATLRYELGNWTRPLKVSELQRDSPYNTRTRQGLTPTPIGNPGLSSMQAAAHPARKPYLFYVVKPCGNGGHAFSSTEAKFAADVARYNAARQAKGGNNPKNC